MAISQQIMFHVKIWQLTLKKMPLGIIYYQYLLIATCKKTNFVYAIPLQDRKMQTIVDGLLHRVFFLTGPPTKLVHRS